jgi:hypothetical protein
MNVMLITSLLIWPYLANNKILDLDCICLILSGPQGAVPRLPINLALWGVRRAELVGPERWWRMPGQVDGWGNPDGGP